MKHQILLSLLLLFIYTNVNSQYVNQNPHSRSNIHSQNRDFKATRALSNDTTFDVKFYHLDVEIAIDSAHIQGNVSYLFTSKIDGLTNLTLDLDSAFIIDSISSPAVSFTFIDNKLTVNFSNTFNQGDLISFAVFYHGSPQLAGGYKGLRYETHGGNQPVIASLSTPYLAHTWWPCKDGVHDKADSTFIDITIKDTVVNTIPMIALSNGLLDTVVSNGATKTFKWKHYYPIVPYYVMVAISNYKHFQHTFNGNGYSFPIDYYVFSSHFTSAQNGVSRIPDVMAFFTETFGDYPFRNEKYGMTQLGFYGAIENQTNSIINSMSLNWFYISTHELAHQWFADMITCSTWNHGWLNEGFANYSEALYSEHIGGSTAYQNYVSKFEYYDSGSVYLYDVSDPFNVFQDVIYNKGAYVLHMLRGVLGDSTFFKVIKNYATNSNFQYKNATTEDFQQVCETISGKNLDYFFSQWIYDERYPVYHYNFQQNQNSGELDITIHQLQYNDGWRNVFIMPMEIKVEFMDLTDTMVTVFNNDLFQTFSFTFSKTVKQVYLDPNKWILKKAIFDQSVNVSISEISSKKFILYPNPASTQLHLEFKRNIQGAMVTIFDINGKQKIKHLFEPSKTGSLTINTQSLATGIYVIRIVTDKEQYFQKLSIINN